MKNIFFVSIIIVALVSVFAFKKSNKLNDDEGIKFNQISLKEAEEIATKKNKLILVYFHAKWCGPCRQMKMETFSNKEVGDFYNKNFINVSFDVDEGEGRSLSQTFQVSNIPYFLVLDKNKNMVGKTYGYYSSQDFLAIGKKILNHSLSLQKSNKNKL